MPHKDPEKKRQYNRLWREQNLEQERERKRIYMASVYDPEKIREANRNWIKRNPDKNTARVARYSARKRKACPPWADHSAIADVYARAAKITSETGIPHEVDHIIPLAGENVCGLHVSWNLQVLPLTENRRKKNRVLA
jgi:5-methylcytosine-specific restriction endonuclease McrA